MVDRDLALARTVAHGLHELSGTPLERVRALLALQGQDFPGAMSSIALRTGSGLEPIVEAFESGEIVRAYPMRGTVFVMAAEDVRWLSELCNEGAIRAQVKRRSALGLDEEHFTTARGVLEEIASEKGISRQRLLDAWQAAGVDPGSGRGYHVLSYLIGMGIAVYGPLDGSENRVCLAAEWLPDNSSLEARFGGDRTAAAAELLRRYFFSRGPATIRDAAWWSKLPLTLLREAAGALGEEIERIDGDEPVYQRAGLPEAIAAAGKSASAPRLVPGFDELMLGYQDRSYLVPDKFVEKIAPGRNGVFKPTAIASGRVQGVWKRTGRPGKRKFEFDSFGSVSETRRRAFAREFEKFPFSTP